MTAVIAAAETPELFGGVHLTLLLLTVLLAVPVIWGLRRLRRASAKTTILRIAGWAVLVLSVMYMVWLMLPANWDLHRSLPLHYSDILRFISAVALIRQPRWAIGICYFWGLTLNTQAMLTPHPSFLVGPSVGFIFYWVLHIAVLLTPLVLIWGVGHRPRWRDFAVAYCAALLWAALAMTCNAILGTNYAFLNGPPEGVSLIDMLGPWPIYVLWLALLAAAVWALMTWPWTWRSKTRGRAS